MKQSTAVALAACSATFLILSGCAIQAREPISSNPRMKIVRIDGQDVMIAPYSDGTWGATDSAIAPFVVKNAAIERPRLSRAIEIGTGCKVTDAEYNIHTGNVTAAVDCGHGTAPAR